MEDIITMKYKKTNQNTSYKDGNYKALDIKQLKHLGI